MDPSSSDAALKLEIARLTGAIQRRKTEDARVRPYPHPSSRPRSNVYVNPNYKPPTKQTSLPPSTFKPKPQQQYSEPLSTATHDVVIGGVAFQSSGMSLVRKDLPKPTPPPSMSSRPPSGYSRPPRPSRGYNPKPIRGRPSNRNMTLTNNRRPFQSRRVAKKARYVDKPCPRFTTTGACNRGLTCMYQHDPSKIAICWPFLQGHCPNTETTCNLSHDPTPERTPLCVHFANNGRCTRQNCPFPHVRVGQRDGVCRDFAVLGYCAKGLDCDQSHVRECPDFAEKGACATKGCKLPHVIRANRNRKAAPGTAATATTAASTPSAADSHSCGVEKNSSPSVADSPVSSGVGEPHHQVTADDAQMGDEFISLTFHESESEESEDDEDGDEGEEGDDDEDDDMQQEQE